MNFSTIPEAIEDLAAGKMVIVVDNEDRENEGDFVIAAESVTPDIINTMVKMSSGLVCVPVDQALAQKLGLEMMAKDNTAHFGVNFTVSIDAAKGITTGASVTDKYVTIQKMVDDMVTKDDFVRPGHIFPLIARKGGVLLRNGHTEAAVDLVKLAGFKGAAVISEITNQDGTMARLPALMKISQTMCLKIVSIKDLIHYRLQNETIISLVERVALPTTYGTFDLHAYTNQIDNCFCIVLTKGLPSDKPIPVRIHSECLTGDVFRSMRCDCGDQLDMALSYLAKQDAGILIYLKQEGRGIGLLNKIKAYKLQEGGLDTVEANKQLGFQDDLRDYAMAWQVLKHMGICNIKLLTNNPQKVSDLQHFGIQTERIPIEAPVNKSNEKYLMTKKFKMGHLLSGL